MKRLILILLILGILTAPVIPGCPIPLLHVDTDNDVYFVGEIMMVTINSYPTVIYSANFVNTTSKQKIHLTTREVGTYGYDSFEVYLDKKWIPNGTYHLIISVDGKYEDHQDVTVIFDEVKWLQNYNERLQDFVNWSKEWFDRADEYINEQDQKIDLLVIAITLYSLIIVSLCFLSFKLRKVIKEQKMKPRVEIIKFNPYEGILNLCITALTLFSIGLYIMHDDSIYLFLLIPAIILTLLYTIWYRKKEGAKP